MRRVKYPVDFVRDLRVQLPEDAALHRAASRDDFALGDLLWQATLTSSAPARKAVLRRLARRWCSLVTEVTAAGILDAGIYDRCPQRAHKT